MGFFYGAGWDYDTWYCHACGHEIELETTTYPPENADGEEANDD